MSTGAFGAAAFGGEPFGGSEPSDDETVPEIPVEPPIEPTVEPTYVPVLLKASIVLTTTAKPSAERYIRINPPAAAPAAYSIPRKRTR